MRDRRSAKAVGSGRASGRQGGGLLQPLSEAFLYRSPQAPLEHLCRPGSPVRKGGGHDDA